MATKRLDYIAATPVADRKKVMPRIRCKDGTSLSVQASVSHLAVPYNDRGPWISLEVILLSRGAAAPTGWNAFEKGADRVLTMHDHTGIFFGKEPYVLAYMIPIAELRAFIEAHGGEAEENETAMGRNLHAELVDLSGKIDEAYQKVRAAQEAETIAWRAGQEVLQRGGVDGASRVEAENIFFAKYAPAFDAALRNTYRLWNEYQAIVARYDVLAAEDLAALERDFAEAGK